MEHDPDWDSQFKEENRNENHTGSSGNNERLGLCELNTLYILGAPGWLTQKSP